MSQGELVAILGPNGAGKSTFLRILSLQTKATEGQVLINGQDVSKMSLDLRKKVGVLSHHSFLYDNLTAQENLKFYGKLYEVPRLNQRIDEVIGEVGLELYAHEPVRTYSRGMVQRLALARAVLHDPAMLILDEPYTGLDQQAIGILNQVLRNSLSQKRTLLLVTHNFEQGLEFSDRVIIMAKGQIVYQAAKEELDSDTLKATYLAKVGGV